MLDKILNKDANEIKKNSYFWNVVSSIAKAIQLTIFLAVIPRITSTEDAGIMSLAFSIAYLMRTIGDYAMRNFQVTDMLEQYTFKEYLTSRLVTMSFMIICSMVYVLTKGYHFEKALTILLICFYMGIDAIEDVFHGMLQKHNRLDIAAFIESVRYICGIIVFAITLFATRQLWMATLILLLFAALMCLLLNYPVVRFFDKGGLADNWKMVKKLLHECFPLFLGAFLGAYVNNAPKSAIDKALNDEMQGYFGMIFMPVFVINLFSTMVYRPITVRLAEEFNNKPKNYRKSIKVQYGNIAGITFACILGAAFLGIPILSMFYKTNLEGYKTSLVILMFGGGISAAISFSSVLLTIQRKQKEMLYAYGLAAIVSVLFASCFAKKWGILGASLLYALLNIVILVIMHFIIYMDISRRHKYSNME